MKKTYIQPVTTSFILSVERGFAGSYGNDNIEDTLIDDNEVDL